MFVVCKIIQSAQRGWCWNASVALRFRPIPPPIPLTACSTLQNLLSLVWRATVPLSDCWVTTLLGSCWSRCSSRVRVAVVRAACCVLRAVCCVLRADGGGAACGLQSSRARSSVKDDKDGHLVYWPGYVMGARCSCPQLIPYNLPPTPQYTIHHITPWKQLLVRLVRNHSLHSTIIHTYLYFFQQFFYMTQHYIHWILMEIGEHLKFKICDSSDFHLFKNVNYYFKAFSPIHAKAMLKVTSLKQFLFLNIAYFLSSMALC